MKTSYIIAIVAAVVILLIGFRFYLQHKKAPTIKIVKSGVDMIALVNALGGNDNIKQIENTMSKVTCQLNSTQNLDIEAIKRLGATGIVQNQQKLSMIFGKASEAIAIEMKNELHKK